MSLIHTIALVNERHMNGTVSSTRKSDSKRYVACVVATITEESVRQDLAKKTKLQSDLDGFRTRLIALEIQYRVSASEAIVWHEAIAKRWYSESYDIKQRIREEQNLDWRDAKKVDDLALAEMLERGFEQPYMPGTKFDLVDTAGRIEVAEKVLGDWSDPVLGQEGVITWSGSVALANKALPTGDSAVFAAKGHKMTVRTDIQIREAAKRPAKV